MKNKKYYTIRELKKAREIKQELKPYRIPYNKVVLLLGFIGVLLCVLTIGTNWLIPLIIKYTIRYA